MASHSLQRRWGWWWGINECSPSYLKSHRGMLINFSTVVTQSFPLWSISCSKHNYMAANPDSCNFTCVKVHFENGLLKFWFAVIFFFFNDRLYVTHIGGGVTRWPTATSNQQLLLRLIFSVCVCVCWGGGVFKQCLGAGRRFRAV